MKNLNFEIRLPIQMLGGIPFQEMLERELKGKRIIEEISFENERKIPIREMMERERNSGKIIMIGKRPFAVICATVIKPKDYVETEVAKLASQLDKYALNIPTYKLKYKFDTADVDEIIADAAYSRFYADLHNEGATYAHKWTSKGEEMYYGNGSSISEWPTGADVSTPPADVPPGIVDRYRIKVQRMKAMKDKYTVNDGQAMGFEIGHSSINPADGKPHLFWELVAGGHPEIRYVKSIYGGAEFQKNWSDGHGMVALDKTGKSRLTDMGTLPAVGSSALWGYQAIYLLDEKRIGTMSDVIWVTVKGV